MVEATVNTEEWALRLNKELTEARTRIAALEAQIAVAKAKPQEAEAVVWGNPKSLSRDFDGEVWERTVSIVPREHYDVPLHLHPPAPKVTEAWPSAPEGWLVSPPKYHCYPIFVEMISGEWHVCRHHDTAGVSSTVSKHETLSAALTAAQESGQ